MAPSILKAAPDRLWARPYHDRSAHPLEDNLQVAEKFPTLGIRLGDYRPHVRGKIREYLPLWTRTPPAQGLPDSVAAAARQAADDLFKAISPAMTTRPARLADRLAGVLASGALG